MNAPQPGQVGVVSDIIHRTKLVWRLMWDRKVPIAAKLAPFILGALYVFSPCDFVNDLIPVFGQMDDVAAVLFLFGYAFPEMCPPHLVRKHLKKLARDERARWDDTQNNGEEEQPMQGEWREVD